MNAETNKVPALDSVRSEEAFKNLSLELEERNRELSQALTELKRTQRRMIEHERLAALGQMASGIAHDFNNLLMPVLGYADYLLDNPDRLDDKEELHEILETIRDAGIEARETIRRLREFYRPLPDGQREVIDVKRAIERALAVTRPKWREGRVARGSFIHTEVNVSSDLAVTGNLGQLEEALASLILNSIDAMPSGGRITVRATEDSDGARVRIELSDTGTGMTEEVRRRCMEPFYTTKGEHGAGLGLSMTHGIIRQHNGRVEIDSSPGAGTTIVISLPRTELAAATDDPGDEKVKAMDRSLRILVIDDDLQTCEFVKRCLTADGHTAESALDGSEGIRLFREKGFDLVITDWAMPKTSGDLVAEMIKVMDQSTPVIMLTGFADAMRDDENQESCPAGVDVLLGKPVVLQDLRSAISGVMGETKKDSDLQAFEQELRFKWLVPGKLARASGPILVTPESLPKDVNAWISVLNVQGIKSVISVLSSQELEDFFGLLPGGFVSYCARGELEVRHVDVEDYGSPPLAPDDLERVWQIYQEMPKPVLVHCRRGIARAGHASNYIREMLQKSKG